jgi:hypothetical protein
MSVVGAVMGLTGLIASTARAATVAAPAPVVRRALFAAGGVGALSQGPSAPVELVLNKILQQTYQRAPTLDPGVAACEIGQLRQTWSTGQPSAKTFAGEGPNQRIINILRVLDPATPPAGDCAGGAGPWTGPMDVALQAVANLALESSMNSGALGGGFNPAQSGNGGGFTPAVDGLATLQTGVLDAREVLNDAASLSGLDNAFGRAWDLIWGPGTAQTLNEDIFAASAKLIAQNPSLRGPDATAAAKLISPSGTVTTGIGTLTTAASGDLNGLTATTVRAIKNPGESQAAYDQNAAAIGDAHAATAFLSGLIAQGDGAQGLVVAESSTAATAVASIANEWSASLAATPPTPARGAGRGQRSLSGGDLASLGTELASQNYFGAAKSLFNVFNGLFGSDGNSQDNAADQLLAAELGRLQSSFDAFSAQVNQDFHHLDVELAGYFSALHSQLNTLASELRTVQNDLNALKTDVQNVYQGIQAIQVQLDKLEADLYNKITDSTTGNQYWDDVNQYIPYQIADAAGQQMPSSAFHTADADFYTFVNPDATNSVALSPANPSDGPGKVFSNLQTYPLDQNIDYLGAIPSDVLGVPAWPTPLANPRWWSAAGQAYAQLLLSNPNYVTSVQQGRLSSIIGAGTTLAQALRNISAADAATGTKNALLNHLLSYYASYANGSGSQSITSILGQIENAWWHGEQQGSDGGFTGQGAPATLGGLNLWGPANQTPDWAPQIPAITGCGDNTSDALTLPANASLSAVVDNTFTIALRLGLGTYNVSCAAHWTNIGHNATGCQPPSEPRTCTFRYYGDLVTTLTWTYTPADNSAPLTIATITDTVRVPSPTTPSYFICTAIWSDQTGVTPCVHPGDDAVPGGVSAGYAADHDWSGHVENAIGQSGTVTLGGNIPTVTTSVNSALNALQGRLYAYIVAGNDSNNQVYGNLTTLPGTLQAAVTNLDGATHLIDAYAELGLSSALAADDKLRGQLFGDQRILDDAPQGSGPGRITAMYEAAAGAPPVGKNFRGILSARLTVGRTQLQTELTNVVAAGDLGESDPLVSGTLDRLTLASRILSWSSAQAPGQPATILGTAVQTGAPGVPASGLCAQALTPSGAVAASAFTDRNGAYSLFGLPPGRYTLHLTDCVGHFYVPQFYGGGSTFSQATFITAGAGQPVALVNNNAMRLVLGGQINGTVTDDSATPKPLANICVSATNTSTHTTVSARTASNGTYQLASVLPGGYGVVFSDCANHHYVTASYAHNPVAVAAGGTDSGVNVKLVPGAGSPLATGRARGA